MMTETTIDSIAVQTDANSLSPEEISGSLQGRKVTNNFCRNTTVAVSAFIGGALFLIPPFSIIYCEYAPFTISEKIFLFTMGSVIGGSGSILGGIAGYNLWLYSPFGSKANLPPADCD